MSGKSFTSFTLFMLLIAGALVLGCEDDTNYDSRTVVYVSQINEGAPYLSDVLNQGDSLYNEDGVTYKYVDDYVEEDWIKVQFHNRPYSSIVDPCAGSLGDFLVTGYDVEFVPMSASDPIPVPPFSGETSLLVPANSIVEGYILLVPFYAKNILPLDNLKYTANEIMTNARITFHGHEVQTERNIEFSAGVTVGFADPLGEEDPGD